MKVGHGATVGYPLEAASIATLVLLVLGDRRGRGGEVGEDALLGVLGLVIVDDRPLAGGVPLATQQSAEAKRLDGGGHGG